MNVTREVIRDLLPLYEAGEVSGDTRRLVEEFLEQDPELARQLEEERRQLLPDPIPIPLDKETEMQTLERTKRLLKWRAVSLACAVALSFLPVFASLVLLAIFFVADPGGRMQLLPGLMLGLAFAFTLAVFAWVIYFTLRSQLRSGGL